MDDKMEKVQDGEQYTVKGANGEEFLVRSDGVYVLKKAELGSGARFKKVEEEAKESGAKDPAAVAAAAGRKKWGQKKMTELSKKGKKDAKKAVVLKSLNTPVGAQDWLRAMGRKYPGALVVDTDTLKSYDMVDEMPAMGAHHVILEEEIIDSIKSGEVSDVIKTFVKKGFMRVDEFGPCFTDKWHNAVGSFVRDALNDAMKSTSETSVSILPGKINSMDDTYKGIFEAFDFILKSLEDANKLANLSPAAENATTGHALRPNVGISDEEVNHAAHVNGSTHANEANVEDKMAMPEGVTHAEGKAATHAHDHNAGKEVRGQPGKEEEGADKSPASVGSVGNNSTVKAVDKSDKNEGNDPDDEDSAIHIDVDSHNEREEDDPSGTKKSVPSQGDVQGTSAPQHVSDSASRDAVQAKARQMGGSRKATVDEEGVARPDTQPFDADPDAAKVQARTKASQETQKSAEDFTGLTFKSLHAARTWERTENPDPERWYVDSTTFDERKQHGRNRGYIVRERPEHPIFGAYGNRLEN